MPDAFRCDAETVATNQVEEDLLEAGVEQWLVKAVARLARDKKRSLEGLLLQVGEAVRLQDTKATFRCHFIATTPLDEPRVNDLAEKLVDQVVDYCIPRSRISDAQDYLNRTGSTEKLTQLAREARELFTKIKTSGEGGEMLLYLLLEVVLGLPQVLCKMPLKTNSNMHVHGADGVHVKALDNGNLAVYWGESKLYTSVVSAIDACFRDIAPILKNEGGATRRDLLLVRDNLDTGNKELTAALIRYFERDRPEAAMLEVRGACLVGFSLDEYPPPFENDQTSIREQVAQSITDWQERIAKRVGDQELVNFEIEIFFVPFPSVESFRSTLKERLGLPA